MIIILVTTGLCSCEKIIDISIPDKERKLVVNGLISSDQPVKVNLTRSLSVLEGDSLAFITGGQVSLFQGTGLIGKFREDSTGFYSLPDFRPQVGQTYRLTASGNGLNPVEASAYLPPLVPIISVDTATITTEWGQQELHLSVKFTDPAGVRNFYGFGVDVTSKEYDYNTMTYTGKKQTYPGYISSNTDRFLQDESIRFEGKLFFEDMLFDGFTKTVEFDLWDYSFFASDTVWMDLKMEQIDPSYYLYVVSNSLYQQANENPFSERVQVYTNVKGGYGIFSGTSSSRYQFTVFGMKKFR